MQKNLTKKFTVWLIMCSLVLTGCGLFPASLSPGPREFFNMEETAGVLYFAITSQNWDAAEKSFAGLKNMWQEITPYADEKKLQKSQEYLADLETSIRSAQKIEACQDLNRFMKSVSKIGAASQLSPVSDMLNIGIALREVGLYAHDENWEKASIKSKALETAWNRGKPAMEQVGILSEVTRTHSLINRMKDAIESENKDSFDEHFAAAGKSLDKIRKFHAVK